MADIVERIGEIHIAVVMDKETKNEELGAKLSELAVAAIMAGLGEPEWRKYMSIFADNTDQLELLSVATLNEPDYLPKVRAYMVSNAVCAAGTNTATTNGLTTQNKTDLRAFGNNDKGVGAKAVTRPAEIQTLIDALP